MPLSRLENFQNNPKGVVIYCDPGNFDATDSFENRGTSPGRPFATIQRALIEAARFSYQSGTANDLNDRTTILVSPGTYYIDNRPGLSIENSSGTSVYKKRTGANQWSVETFNEFTENSNFDIFDPSNDLYKFNSVDGGVILPRGTSIVGFDLRKTKIRPLYVPDPTDDNIERSSIFKVTGNCYFTAFTFFDADPSIAVYKDYSTDLFVGKYSHHKLTAFTYADGVNKVVISNSLSSLTDLQMYYYKVANAYGDTTERGIPDFPSTTDIEPVIDEYRIVGQLDENLVGISSIRSGDGLGGGILNQITVTTKDLITNLETPHKLEVNTPILISGVSINPTSYNGSFVVNSIVGPNTFTYVTPTIPANKLPSSSQIQNALIKVETDTTSSSSPYILNCSLRSKYGMCGLWADGSKADGFKSIVVAQFTGISLQRDDDAFLLYSKTSNNYIRNSQLAQSSTERPLHTNPFSIYNPEYENFHIRASNNSFIQCVSIFAIGYARQFVTESGGDMSITNSNSNFGTLALQSEGFRNESFNRDDVGYITHVIPPREIPTNETTINWLPINVGLTTSGNNPDKRLFLYDYNDINVVPPFKVDGYRIGAKVDDILSLELGEEGNIYTSPILMEVNSGEGISAFKEYEVDRNINGVNSITNDTFEFTENHQLVTGEKVRIFSSNGRVPDGLETNKIYYVIRVDADEIKLAYNFNDALGEIPITGISNNGGILKVVSSVADKQPGDIGHPIQWDETVNNWYVRSSNNNTKNQIYTQINSRGVEELGEFTLLTTFNRVSDTRSIEDRLYKIRYVIPKEYKIIREPTVGFVLQETKTVGVTTSSINPDSDLTISDRRNERVISSISAGAITNNSQLVTVKTEVAHRFIIGDTVNVKNVKSTFNPTATGITSSFNGSYEVVDVIDSLRFNYRISGLSTNPGSFTNELNVRSSNTLSSLPTVSREKYNNTLVVYRVDVIKPHIPGNNGQDGVYHLTLISSNVKTSSNIGYGLSQRNYNQDVRDLYPQLDRDNYVANPPAAVSYADHSVLGKVITNKKTNSLTKESIEYFLQNTHVGVAISSITLSGVGNTTITIVTDVEHKLNSIKNISLTNAGSGLTGDYYGSIVERAGVERDALCNYSTSGGEIDEETIEFTDYGSSFGNGQTISIGNSAGIATVTEINSNISGGFELCGFEQEEFNDVFRIVSATTSRTIVLESNKTLPNYVENTGYKIPFGVLTGNRISIDEGVFGDVETGIVTVTTNQKHGLLEGNSFKIVGSGHTVYDSTFVVNSVIGINTFTFVIEGAESNPPLTTGNIYRRLLAPNAKSSGRTGENLGNRANYIYGGLSVEIDSLVGNLITLENRGGFRRGDYIQINNEIVRLIGSFNQDNECNVQRGVFGTIQNKDATIVSGTLGHKIKIIPAELRRPSFLRASGHTFEYLGYGPGNYSTSVPQKQTRKLSNDEIVASQSRKTSGGTVVYSGMNDIGEFYFGAKKVSAITGQETVVEAPILSFVGDDADGSDDPSRLSGIFDNILVRQKLTVEGGENGEDTSTFRGPVTFDKRVTFKEQFAVPALNIQGRRSRGNKVFTLSDKTTYTANGSISYVGYNTSFIGEIKTEPGWRRWGLISKSANKWDLDLDIINVKEKLTVGGIEFTGVGISQLNLINLNVSGIATFSGEVYGNNSNILNVKDTILVGSGDTTSTISSDGRTINLGITTSFPNLTYGLRIRRDVGIGSVKSQILHRGNDVLEIKAENTGGSILLDVVNGPKLSLEAVGIERLVSVTSNTGANGATQLAIGNTGTGDAIISWKQGALNEGFWFAGIDSSDSRKWKLAYSGEGVGITNSGFNTTTTRVAISTEGVLTAGKFEGNGTIPIGGIIMWSGSIDNIPSGWNICNGANGTPDLRERFIVGAGGNSSVVGAAYTVGQTGGTRNAVVVSHSHSTTVSNSGIHSHFTVNDETSNDILDSTESIAKKRGASGAEDYDLAGSDEIADIGLTSPAGQHNHTVTVEVEGESGVDMNLPPYYALAFIMRVA